LWQLFDYYELTENVRQKDDQTYGEMLSRIRYGNPSAEDIQALQSRVIDKNNFAKITQLMEENNLIFLGATLAQVDIINELMTKQKNIQIIDVTAEDITIRNNIIIDDNNMQKLKNNETAGLNTKLQIGVNSQIMLKRNINVQNGLCNGAIGKIISFNYDNNNNITTIKNNFL